MRQTIPVVHLQKFREGSAEQKAEFVQVMGDALRDFGFFALEGHSIDDQLMSKTYSSAQDFFLQSDDIKAQYDKPDLKGQRGFVSFGREHAKGSKFPDLKEFWHVGRNSFKNDEMRDQYIENIWPKETPTFKPTMSELYDKLDSISFDLLEACALYLDQPRSFFKDMVVDGNTLLRVIHYPPIDENMNPNSVRAAAHEDINFITLLCESTAGGLELLDHEGNWIPIHALKGQIIVDAGDMLQNLTNGYFKSTTHRVVNPDLSKERRLSIPFFVHPRSEVDLSPRDWSLDKTDGQKKFPNITAGEFLHKRLVEIGLA